METITQSVLNFNLSLKYGILGLGIVGRKIAEILVYSGHEVFVFDKDTPLMVCAKPVLSPSELFDKVDILFSCTSDTLVLQEVSRVRCHHQHCHFKPNIVSFQMFFEDCGRRLKSLTVLKEKGYVQMICLDEGMSQQIAEGIVNSGGRYLKALVIWLSSISKYIGL